MLVEAFKSAGARAPDAVGPIESRRRHAGGAAATMQGGAAAHARCPEPCRNFEGGRYRKPSSPSQSWHHTRCSMRRRRRRCRTRRRTPVRPPRLGSRQQVCLPNRFGHTVTAACVHYRQSGGQAHTMASGHKNGPVERGPAACGGCAQHSAAPTVSPLASESGSHHALLLLTPASPPSICHAGAPAAAVAPASPAAASCAAAAARTCRSVGRPSKCSKCLATPTARERAHSLVGCVYWQGGRGGPRRGTTQAWRAASRAAAAVGQRSAAATHLWAGQRARPGGWRCHSGAGAAHRSRRPAAAAEGRR